MTLKEFFKRSPINKTALAARLNKSAAWLYALEKNKLDTRDKAGALSRVEREIHKLADELKSIKITEK